MWTVDTDAFLSKTEKRALLGILQGQSLQRSEYDRICYLVRQKCKADTWPLTVRDDDRMLAGNSFICHSCCEITGQEDGGIQVISFWCLE